MLWLQQTAQMTLLAVVEVLVVMAERLTAPVQTSKVMLSWRLKVSAVLVDTPR
jgi:hypothetical protein